MGSQFYKTDKLKKNIENQTSELCKITVEYNKGNISFILFSTPKLTIRFGGI